MKVYEKIWRSLQARVGQRTCWELPFFYEGMIQKVVCKQVGGPTTNFTLKVFNSHLPCSGATSRSSGGADPAGAYEADPDMYLVFSPFQGVAGETMTFISTAGRAYRNMDGSQSLPQRKIYVEIDPAGVGGADDDATWDLCLGGWSDVG